MINRPLEIHIDGLSLYSVYGNACLGLRHPSNKGGSKVLALIAIQSIGAYLVESGVISDKIRFEHEKGLIIEPEAAIIIERLGSFMHVVTSKDIISGIGIGKNFASGCMVCLLSCEEVVVI